MTFSKFYFPNLNGLRFIAAFLVIISHFHEHRNNFGLSNLWENPVIIGFGNTGVNIFFVLSGFLITTLLLSEKRETYDISLKNFYARRILRIWPLYFLIILFCFFLAPKISLLQIPGVEFPASHFWQSFLVFVLILPSFAMHLFGHIPLATMTWSIGVEEIFYLVTPLLLKFTKHILISFLVFVLLFFYLGNGFIFNPSNNNTLRVIILFLADLRLACLGLGSIAAILYLKYPSQVTKWVLNLPVQIIFYLLSFLSILKIIDVPVFNNEVFSFFAAVIILNLALNKKSLLQLNHPVLEYLGKISYGIYMYHLFPIVLFCHLMPGANPYLVFVLDNAITIGLAALSYKYFESYFLRLKRKF